MPRFPFKSYISLRKGEKFVRIRSEIENRAKNSQKSFAYIPFDIVERKIESIDPKGRMEYPYNYYPFQNFMGVFDEERGLAISAKGLYEYEIKDDEEKTIALTLIRAIGWLSKELPSRYTIAGPIIETPSAQCLRKLYFEYAIIPFKGSYENILRNSLDFIEDIKVFYGGKYPKSLFSF
jgi:alpha-mannosidase